MDFEKLFKELKESLLKLFGEKWKEFKGESEKDINEFLDKSKEKLERWTSLLVEKKITLDEYKWLVKSQKDLLVMETLYKAGLSRISLGHFKNKVIKTIVDVVKTVVL